MATKRGCDSEDIRHSAKKVDIKGATSIVRVARVFMEAYKFGLDAITYRIMD